MTNTLKMGMVKVMLAMAFLCSVPSAMKESQSVKEISKKKAKSGMGGNDVNQPGMNRAKITINQPTRGDQYQVQDSEGNEMVDQENQYQVGQNGQNDQNQIPGYLGKKKQKDQVMVSQGQYNFFVFVAFVSLGVSIWQMVESIMLLQKSEFRGN